MRGLCVILCIVVNGVLSQTEVPQGQQAALPTQTQQTETNAAQPAIVELGENYEEFVSILDPEQLTGTSFVEMPSKPAANMPQTVPLPDTRLPQTVPQQQSVTGGGARAFYDWLNRVGNKDQEWAAVPNQRPNTNNYYDLSPGESALDYSFFFYNQNQYYNYMDDDAYNYDYEIQAPLNEDPDLAIQEMPLPVVLPQEQREETSDEYADDILLFRKQFLEDLQNLSPSQIQH